PEMDSHVHLPTRVSRLRKHRSPGFACRCIPSDLEVISWRFRKLISQNWLGIITGQKGEGMGRPPLSAKILFGPFELDPASGELRKRERKVRLSEQSFQILNMLV